MRRILVICVAPFVSNPQLSSVVNALEEISHG